MNAMDSFYVFDKPLCICVNLFSLPLNSGKLISSGTSCGEELHSWVLHKESSVLSVVHLPLAAMIRCFAVIALAEAVKINTDLLSLIPLTILQSLNIGGLLFCCCFLVVFFF